MKGWLSRFRIHEHGSTVGKEVLGGATTYMTLAYIVFVQPVVLSAAGMDFGAVLTATCLGSGLACFLMGLLANYPIALAPAMGHNFYFAYAVIIGMGVPWQRALGAVCVAGLIFFAISLTNLRQLLINAIPKSLASAIACGIGLLISLVGLEWSGIIVAKPGTYVGLDTLSNPPVLLALAGILITAALMVRRISGAILLGIMLTTLIGLGCGLIQFHGIVSRPLSLSPSLLRLDLPGLFAPNMLVVIAIFLFLDIFDTIGTLIGVAPEAGLVREGLIELKRNAFLAIVTRQLSVSITDGIAFGFISHSFLSLCNGRIKETSPAIHSCSLLLLLRNIYFAK